MRRSPGAAGIAAAAFLALAGGCATVMSEGTGNALHADAQKNMAGSIEAGLAPLRPLFAGKEVAVRLVRGAGRGRGDAPLLYARECLREMIAAEGGVYAGETGTDLQLEIWSAQAGTRATERNLVVNAGQYIRVPIFYGEGFEGESGIVVVARGPGGEVLTPPTAHGAKGETEYYLFRMIGPFHR